MLNDRTEITRLELMAHCQDCATAVTLLDGDTPPGVAATAFKLLAQHHLTDQDTLELQTRLLARYIRDHRHPGPAR